MRQGGSHCFGIKTMQKKKRVILRHNKKNVKILKKHLTNREMCVIIIMYLHSRGNGMRLQAIVPCPIFIFIFKIFLKKTKKVFIFLFLCVIMSFVVYCSMVKSKKQKCNMEGWKKND